MLSEFLSFPKFETFFVFAFPNITFWISLVLYNFAIFNFYCILFSLFYGIQSWHYSNYVMCYVCIKVEVSPSRKKMFYLFQWNPFKMLEHDFYIILKALFVLKIFRFLFWFFLSFKNNSLIRKITLTLKFMTSQPG